MRNQYVEIKDNYSEMINEGYDIERFKGLPFNAKMFNREKHNYKAETGEINDQIKSLANSIRHIKKSIENEDYSNSINAMNEIYSSFRRNRQNHKFAGHFAANFSQFTLMADEVGVEYTDLTSRIENLCKASKDSFAFMEPMAKFINEYVQLEKYIKTSMYNEDELNIYKEEIDDLLSRHKETLSTSDIYLNMESSHVIDPQIREFQIIKEDMLFRIKQKDPTVYYNMSEFYHRDINLHSGDLAGFMVDKKYENDIVSRITLTESQKIQDYIVFDDGSSCYKKGGIYQVVKDQQDHKKIVSELEHSIIAYQLRKKPKIAQYISTLYTNSGYNSSPVGQLENVMIVIDTYLNNETILKNMKMDLSVFEKKSFEAIDDHMNELIKSHKLHHYANSILSNKNKHLLNEASLDSFEILMSSGVSKSVIQNLVGKKLSAISTPEEFEKYLEKVVTHISSFDEDILLDKLNTAQITPVYKENNVIVFEIDTFEQSQKLGSPSWCISRTEYYFKDYKSEGNKQYFMYDFNKSEKDNESMIGFTIKTDGSMKTQHSKNDDYHDVDDYLENIINNILYTEQSKYKLSTEITSKLNKEFNQKNKKNENKGPSL